MVKEIVLERLLTEAFDRLIECIKKENSKPKLMVSKTDLINALDSHLNYVEQFSSNVQIKEMTKARSLSEIYVNLDIKLQPKRWGQGLIKTKESTVKVTNIFDDGNHAIILGEPGAGKTTSSKKICQLLLHSESDFINFEFPILIRLRDLKPKESVFDRLVSILNFSIKFTTEQEQEQKFDYLAIRNKLLLKYIDELNTLIILDGLDESPEKKQSTIVSEFSELVLNLNTSKALMTSRSGAFEIVIQNATVFEICSLTEKQIEYFIERWFTRKRLASKFKKDLSNSPFHDTLIKPLNLTYLCALFERDEKIPDQPKIVYKKIIRLMLEDWDRQNSVKRETKFSHLDIEERYDFFCHLSFLLTSLYSEKVYSEDMLKNVYKEIYSRFNLSKKEMRNVIEELESHHGLFIKSGFDCYEFDHKSIQEFFCAEFLVKLPSIPLNSNLVNEYAVAASLSPEPSKFIIMLIFQFLEIKILTISFFEQFLTRIIQEKIIFTKDPLLFTAVMSAYSNLYVKVLSTSNLYRATDDLEKSNQVSLISRIILQLKNQSYYMPNVSDLKNFFEIQGTNSNGIVVLRPNGKMINLIDVKIGSRYTEILKDKLFIKNIFIE
ncbi:MAG: NACHT domain-containing protein [Flammeovirgaceae bacterium]|jgi:predicted NACHT family NTPase|nr:NACHT domain-containing protein [Flammeovirgaceae bacterium]